MFAVNFTLSITLPFLFEFAGNVVTMVVLSRDKERRHTLFLLKCLATADAFYLIMAFLCYPLQHMMQSRETHLHMLLYMNPLLKIAQFICIYMIVLVTVDRYLYVKMPHRAETIINHKNRHLWVVGICSIALLFNMPLFFDSCVMTFLDVCTDTSFYVIKVYRDTFNNPIYINLYEYGAYMIVLYVGPLLVLLYMNTALVFYIKRSLTRQLNQYRAAYTDHSDNNATQVLIIIVVVFIVCETPELIVKVLAMAGRHFSSVSISLGMFKVFTSINELLMVVNSSVNFIVYFAFGKRFRMVMKDTFRIVTWHSPVYL